MGMGIVRFNVPLDTFLGHFGDGGVTEASARIIVVVSTEASSAAQPRSVCGGELCCATTVDNSGRV